MVLLALLQAKASDPEQQARAERRAIQWLLGMQSSDGGWAAFDVDNNWQFLNKVPFADHNAMLDPTCPDITGRVWNRFAAAAFTTRIRPLRGDSVPADEPGADGSWYGRWGVNYVYGTFLPCAAWRPRSAPEATTPSHAGARWLREAQNPDGGWGESCLGYETGRFERTVSTPSQTAWAVLGLIAAGGIRSSAVAEGLALAHRAPARRDGSWEERTGLPARASRASSIFIYQPYRNYFPLLALGTYAKSLAGGGVSELAMRDEVAVA